MASGQYLTAVFALRPSRRKAAALERVRAAAEAIFWGTLASQRERADSVAAEADNLARRLAWRAAEREIAVSVTGACARAAIAEPVAQGLSRDVQMAIGSYVELRVKGHAAEWPAPVESVTPDHTAALDLFLGATTREQENEARDALTLAARRPGPRPLTLARSRDALLVRTGPTGGIAAVLNVLRASDPKARPAAIRPGVEAASGEAIGAGVSKTKLVIPVECSRWHEHKFLSGRAVLRSSLIVRRGDRWFMCAQFEVPRVEQRLTGARLGVNRGIINPLAMAVVRPDGLVLAVPPPAYQEIGRSIRAADEKRRAEQKRRGVTHHRHVERVEHALHRLANDVVARAKSFGAQVVVEKLDEFKQIIARKRPPGSPKGGWRKSLKKMQMTKLEAILAYKLRLAGLPPLRDVVPAGISITCPACSTRDPRNRPSQERFVCLTCGFAAQVDSVAAVNVARRGVVMKEIKRGDKIAPREQDMVAGLRSRDDGGLGPLAAVDDVASGLVAVRASAMSAYEGRLPLTDTAGQNHQPGTQNVHPHVISARSAAIRRRAHAGKVPKPQGPGP